MSPALCNLWLFLVLILNFYCLFPLESLSIFERKIKLQIYLQIPPPVFDNLGRVVPNDTVDLSDARCGIALALGELSPKLSEEEVSD